MPKPFLKAEWKNLLMANYSVDPTLLKPYLPCHTELDSFNGIHYVSLVGFMFANTKVLGVGFPFHRNFQEVNLRFYVRYNEGGKWKRGVVFLKEIVPKHMITFVANSLYGEHYTTLPMKHSWRNARKGFEVEYHWRFKNEWNFMKAVAEEKSEPLTPGSEEEFITEHYWGYTFINDDCSGTYQVDHPRWKVHKVNEFSVFCNAAELYGTAFAETLQQRPSSVFLAEGSAVSVMKGNRILASLKK
jgi:hypothetical protein